MGIDNFGRIDARGPDPLKASITEPCAQNRQVYLPAGAQWTGLCTGKEVDGGRTVVPEKPIDYLPVFIKDGFHPQWTGAVSSTTVVKRINGIGKNALRRKK